MSGGGKMRKTIVSILIILLYCFPFVYYSMYQDYTNGSLLGYLLMIVGTSILAFLAKYFNNLLPFIIGNIASLIVSFYFIYRTGDSWHDGYFKPLTPNQLLFLVSFLNLIPQFLVMMLVKKFKSR